MPTPFKELSPTYPRISSLEYAAFVSVCSNQQVSDEPLDEDVKTFNQLLSSGTFSQYISYDTPFASSPSGIAFVLSAPDGGSNFPIQLRESSRAAAGFIVDFAIDVPSAGYRITGVAQL